MDDLVPHAGDVADGMGWRFGEIEVIGQSAKECGWQIEVECRRNRGLDRDHVVADADRRQPDRTGRWPGLLALTGAGPNHKTLVVTSNCKTQLHILRNDRWRLTCPV